MGNLQLANKCNLFSYSFSEENQETLQKLKEFYQKPFRFWQKKLKDLKKTWSVFSRVPVLLLRVECDFSMTIFVVPWTGSEFERPFFSLAARPGADSCSMLLWPLRRLCSHWSRRPTRPPLLLLSSWTWISRGKEAVKEAGETSSRSYRKRISFALAQV